jgi:hypothetical protein
MLYESGSDFVIENQEAGEIKIYNNGSQRAAIDSSGRLLVGTSSDSQNTTLLLQGSSAGGGSSFLRLCNSSSVPGDGSNLSVIGFCDSGHTHAATILSARDGGTWNSGSSQPTRLVFSTTADGASSPTERMRISADGTTSLLGDLDIDGSYRSNIVAVAALDIDCSAGNYFTKTISSNSTFTFSNATSSRAISFTLELTHTSGTVTWPASVKWPSDTAPTLTTGKTHLFMFVTDDGGTRWRGAALVDYVN